MATVAVALRREAAEAAVRAAERVVLTVANSATAVATVAAMVVGPPAGREVVGSPAARAATMGSTRKLSTPCESWFQLCASRAAATGVRVSTTPVLDARPAYGEWHFDAGPGEKCHSGILSHARSASRVDAPGVLIISCKCRCFLAFRGYKTLGCRLLRRRVKRLSSEKESTLGSPPACPWG